MNPGERVGGKYRLLRQLGAGAMGTVWEAVNEGTSRRVAIKLINRPSDDLRHRLLREARACGAISHRNVIEIYDVGETKAGEPFLVMQLLSGEPLADLLTRQRRLAPALAAQIGRDIARALAAAHAANIIHRDLKPANVFLHHEEGTDGQVVKVLDFGVAKSLDANESLVTMVGGAVGSPAYMSPEQIRAERDLDGRTDIWSLGVVLFEMLTGVRPFQGSGQELLTRVLVGPVPRVSRSMRHVDPALDELVARCLERERQQRIGSAAELAQALSAFVGENEGSRVHVGLAERAMMSSVPDLGMAPPSVPMAMPASGPVIQEAADADLEATMPLRPQAHLPIPVAPVAPPASLEVTTPLPQAATRPVGKSGTMLMNYPSAPTAMGPRGTALIGDVRAKLAQTGEFGPPSSPSATAPVAVVQPLPPSPALPVGPPSIGGGQVPAPAAKGRSAGAVAALVAGGLLVLLGIGGAVFMLGRKSEAEAPAVSTTASTPVTAAPAPSPSNEAQVEAPIQPAPAASSAAPPVASAAAAGAGTAHGGTPPAGTKPEQPAPRGAPSGTSKGGTGPRCTGTGFLKKCK
jgi:serine/threonine-protein kinase